MSSGTYIVEYNAATFQVVLLSQLLALSTAGSGMRLRQGDLGQVVCLMPEALVPPL